MEFIIKHWQEVALAIMVLDKIVAATTCKWDDIILTAIKSAFNSIRPGK
jgi:hypothetical protein